MNKLIKYGVVAGLTMAAFSLAGAPATYASTADGIYVCGSTAAVETGSTVVIAEGATSCALTFNFTNAITYPTANILNTSNNGGLVYVGSPSSSDYATALSNEGHTATFTLNENGINKVKAAGAAGIDVTLSDNTESFTINVKCQTWEGSFTYSLDGGAATATPGAIEVPADATSLVFTATFEKAFTTTPPFDSMLAVNGLTMAEPTPDLSYVASENNHVATITLTEDGLNKIKDAGEDGIEFSVKANDETYTVTLKAKAVVELESVEATITDDKISTTYNEGYEGEPALGYAVEDDYEDIVTVAADGTISVAETYKTATSKDVTITVTATDGEIVKTTTVTYTIAANYTAVEAELESDTIKASEEMTIVTPEVEGVTYEYEYGYPIVVAEDGTISVVEGYLSNTDETVNITVRGFVGEGEDAVELTSKILTLTVKGNWAFDDEKAYEVVEGDKQTVVAGTKKALTFKIDAPYSQFMSVELYNKTLYDYFDSIDKSEMTPEEIEALLTEEQWESLFMWLVEGEDYTVEEGSTVITLSDSLVAKLVAGEYELVAYYRDDTDIDNIVDSAAEATFTVTAAAPDTGAATAVKSGATSSVLASVLAAITAAGAAVVAKFAKRK